MFAAILLPSGPTQPVELADDEPTPAAAVAIVHKDKTEDVARIRAYRIAEGDKKLHLLRGEFHCHTEFSTHRDQDGLLEVAWRCDLNAADLDWQRRPR